MYCYLNYIDYIKPEEISTQSTMSVQTEQSVKKSNLSIEQKLSFQSDHSSRKYSITETKQLLFNPNCCVQILLDYLCEQTGIDKNSDFDLCDETGQLLNIKQLKAWSYATTVLTPRQSYIIVFYEKNENGQYTKITPLLSKQSKLYAETLLRLKRSTGSSTRKFSQDSAKRSKRSFERSSRISARSMSSQSSVKEAQKRHGFRKMSAT